MLLNFGEDPSSIQEVMPICPIAQGAPSLSAVLTKIPLCPCVKKDVKLSKDVKNSKHMDYGGGSQNKIN